MSETCPICFEEFVGQRVMRTACAHRFCFSCLDKWTDVASGCPLCRAQLPKVVLMHYKPEATPSGWLYRLGSNTSTPETAPIYALGNGQYTTLWGWLCHTTAPEQCRWTAKRLTRLISVPEVAVMDACVDVLPIGEGLLRSHFEVGQSWVHDVCSAARNLGLARYPVSLVPAIMDLFVLALAQTAPSYLSYQALLVAAIQYAALQLQCLVWAEDHRGFVQRCYLDAVPDELERAEAVVRPLRATLPVPFATVK